MKESFLIGALALLWGILWGVLLQLTRWGQWLAARHMWIAVVVIGTVDVLFCFIVIPARQVGKLAIVLGASSLGFIVRCLYNEHRQETR